ncbi:MAG: beta-lactamase family protein, partial [Elusimicrobia bacterium]|nr:beta-lactamase family protein [Elusimicrobiota bacterium]
PVALGDLWHLGSDTKAMTSALIARLVERKRLRWTTTLAEAFPGFAAAMNPGFRDASLLDLLSHRAGLPHDVDYSRYAGSDLKAERLRLAGDVLSGAPLSPPGSRFQYSNVGYIIAAAAAEAATGRSWETEIKREVFAPLGMDSCGFGGVGTPGEIDEPWPHEADGRPAPRNGPDEDNPPVLDPAGRVHCSLGDWAKFVIDQLRGAQGMSGLLSAQSYRVLQTPAEGGGYALGWIVARRDWGGGTVLTHIGSNTLNVADVWIAPNRDFALLVCINEGGDRAAQAADRAIAALLELANGRSSR